MAKKLIDMNPACPSCQAVAYYSKYCGCFVCDECGQHFHSDGTRCTQRLVQCFCGWGKQSSYPLPDDIGTSIYLGDGEWEVDY